VLTEANPAVLRDKQKLTQLLDSEQGNANRQVVIDIGYGFNKQGKAAGDVKIWRN
jgi:hypothetical protein